MESMTSCIWLEFSTVAIFTPSQSVLVQYRCHLLRQKHSILMFDYKLPGIICQCDIVIITCSKAWTPRFLLARVPASEYVEYLKQATMKENLPLTNSRPEFKQFKKGFNEVTFQSHCWKTVITNVDFRSSLHWANLTLTPSTKCYPTGWIPQRPTLRRWDFNYRQVKRWRSKWKVYTFPRPRCLLTHLVLKIKRCIPWSAGNGERPTRECVQRGSAGT